ncbi:regulatory iron-sulfur-containing complex subunit RicT, partial [Chryseobacterium contaminans]
SCGRELCCSTWLTDFRSVNTNVARYQQLSINPQKLAGQCGKLKCCLNYELDSYLDALSNFPSSSTTLETEKGKAFCIKIDVFKKKMWFAYVENSIAWYDFDIDLVKKLIAKNKRGEKTLPLEELKQPETSSQSIDLIQENNVDRFEKKNRNNRNRNNQNKQNNNQNQGQGQGQKKNRPERQDKPNRSEKPENPNANSSNQPRQPKPQQQQKAPVEKVKAESNPDTDKAQQGNPNKKKF